MNGKGGNTPYLHLDDMENPKGSECRPKEDKPPCPVKVGMNITCALAFFHYRGNGHANEHKYVENV